MLCTKLFTGCISSYNWIYPIVNEAVDKELDDDLDFNPERVIETILAVLRHPLMQLRESSVLLLNLGIHYPIGVNFTTYQKLISDLINKLKETRVDSQGNIVPKYKAKIIWKTSSAIHKEKAQELNKTHWRFFTTQVREAVACRTGVFFFWRLSCERDVARCGALETRFNYRLSSLPVSYFTPAHAGLALALVRLENVKNNTSSSGGKHNLNSHFATPQPRPRGFSLKKGKALGTRLATPQNMSLSRLPISLVCGRK